MAGRSKKVVPECHKELDLLKYEIAAEMGLPVGQQMTNSDVEFATELGSIPASSVKEDYWGHISSRDAGAVGGAITSRLMKKAEEILLSL
ncbi:alpha/beta-type small acid-soluble spore protein [Paenibacillus thalictri]|uniref:Alpha/beta-type small acid-soluble spore protein n=1 Tax=Paenibacillus thalictri TaxID=2527873 RepID=A0A4Q9DJA5_9BACL|nr:alpha/beta-type small acid-soluble spore protein [Paenibacillus thalictri]TBL72981.1 alpha/beta-type small acid-soluble spore protein [Paenibacillus thalictri]